MAITDKGFTLVEFLVAFVVSSLLATGLYIAYRSNYRSFNVTQDMLEMQMNARTVVSEITRSLRMVGFGSKRLFEQDHPEDVQYNPLSEDSSYSENFASKLIFFKPATSTNGTATERADALAIVYASRYIGKIVSIVDPHTVVLDDASALSTNATSYPIYNIYIYPDPYQGNHKLANISGNTLTFVNQHHAQVNDECYLLESNFIHLVNNSIRIDHNVAPSSANNNIVENIETIQFQIALDQNNNGIIEDSEWQNFLSDQDILKVRGLKIFVLARSANQDPDYVDNKTYTVADQTFGPFNDHFHRMLLTTAIIPRNLYLKN